MKNTLLSSTFYYAVLAAGIFCCPISTLAFQSVEPPSKAANSSTIPAMKRLEFQKALLKNRLEEAQRKLQELALKRQEIQRRLSQNNISEASFGDVMRVLQTQRVQLIIDLAGLDAKQELLKARLKEEEAAPLTDSAGKLNELLESYVANQRQAVERIASLKQNGSASNAEVMQAKQMLIQAEIRLAESKQAQSAEGTRSLPLLDVLIATELERVEKKARLSQVETLLGSFADLSQLVDNISTLDRDRELEAARMKEHLNRLRRIDDQMFELQTSLRNSDSDQD